MASIDKELARLKGLQNQKPTQKEFLLQLGKQTPTQRLQNAPKLPISKGTSETKPKPKQKVPSYSGRLSGHGMNLTTEQYQQAQAEMYDSPSEKRAAARASAIGNMIVGSLASTYETSKQRASDYSANLKKMKSIAPVRDRLGELKRKRAVLLTKSRGMGKEEAERVMGVKLNELDKGIAEAQSQYDSLVTNTPVDQNSFGQRTLEKAAQQQLEAKKGLGKVGSFFSDASISIGSSVPGIATSVVAPQVGLPILGAQAAGQKSHELSKRGIGSQEAWSRGIGSGLIEIGTETVPVGKLAKLVKGAGGKAFLRGVIEQSGAEATEESISYIANFLADKAAKDPEAQFSLSELAQSAATGALSGGVLGSAASVGNRAATGRLPQLPNMRRKGAASNHSLDEQAMQAVQQVPQGKEPRLPDTVQGNNNYMKQIHAVMHGVANPRSQIVVGDTPFMLTELGANQHKLTLDYSDIRKIAYPDGYMGGKHNLGFYALEQLPKQLENPVAILKSSTQPNSLVIFTELLDAQKRPVMVPIHLDKNGRIGVSNEIASMYGRSNFEKFVAVQKEAGNVIYEDKNRDLQTLPASGLQLSGVEAKADPIFNSTIAQSADSVNSQSMQNESDYEQELADSDFGRNTVGSAESAYPRKQKVSKVRSNTIEHSPMFTKAEKEMLKPDDYRYDVISEKQSLHAAKQRLQVDFTGEENDLPSKQDFSGEDLDTSMGILETYLDEALDTGDYSKVMKWSKMVQEKGTQGGQLIQSFAKYSRTPEGAVIKAQQVVDSVKREISKAKPKLADAVKEETKLVEEAVGSAEKEASKAAAELLPEEMLARRIASTTRQPKKRENAIRDMVNELFRSAKESPLPDQIKIKRSPVEALEKAIDNKEQYSEVWEKAKVILKTKYADDLEVSSMLEDYFQKGIIPTYSTKTLTGSISEAVDSVGADLNQIIKQSKGDKEKLLQDITEYLTTKTGATGEQAQLLSEQIAKRYDEILKEKTASKLQSMFKDRPKLGQKSLKEKVMELINMGAYDTDDLRALVSKRNGIPVLTNEDTKNIIEYMTEAQKHAEDSYERKMFESKAEQIIADKVPATFREKFRGMQRLSMLLNPKTLITRNPLGNTILGIAENVKDVPGTMIDKLVGLKTGERTTSISLKSLVAQGEGFVQGLADWTKDIKNHVDTSPSRGQMELPNNRIFNGKLLNALDNFERRALQLGDRPFYQSAYNGRLAELKKLGVTGEDAKLQARLFALDRVFQNDSTLAKKAGAIRRELGIVGDLIMPFTQTPANVMDKLIDYSPAGLGKAIHQWGKASKDGGFDQKLFVDRMARTFTGSGILMLGYALASAGLATGDLDKDKDVRAAQYAYGITPFSFKFGDSYYSFDWAQPIGGLLSIGANAFTAGKESKDFVGKVIAGTEAGVNTVFSQQFLQGVFNMLSGYNPAAGIGKSLLGSTSQATPSGLAALAKTIDPNVRETYDPKAIVQQGKKLAARLPGVSMMLPKKLDAFGEPILQSQGRNLAARAFENFLSPGKLTTLQHKDVYDELNRLYKQTGSASVFPNVAPKSFDYDGEKIVLSSEEYETFAKAQGKIVKDNVKNLIQSAGYSRMSDEQKCEAVQSLYEYAGAVAKTKVSAYELDSAKQKVKDAEDSGIAPAKYYIAYTAQKDIQADKDGEGNSIKGTSIRKKREAINSALKKLSFTERDLLYQSMECGLSESYEKRWEDKDIKSAVGSKENYYQIADIISNTRADRNRKGNPISGSKKAKVINKLVSMGYDSRSAAYIYKRLSSTQYS